MLFVDLLWLMGLLWILVKGWSLFLLVCSDWAPLTGLCGFDVIGLCLI
jgi:hypothetical protein